MACERAILLGEQDSVSFRGAVSAAINRRKHRGSTAHKMIGRSGGRMRRDSR